MQAAETTPPVDQSEATVVPSCPASPEIYCSQLRFKETEEMIGFSPYPTPPAAPRKDQYHSSESASDSEVQGPALRAKVFRRGMLMHHVAYKGPKPISYVDTGLYEDGRHDYIEAYNERDLLWARRMDYVLRRHQISRFGR
jgi:hypothetical protein